jgi:hypothetical protein
MFLLNVVNQLAKIAIFGQDGNAYQEKQLPLPKLKIETQ